MKIEAIKTIVTSPGQNFVTVRIVTECGLSGVGDGTLNGRELAVASYLDDHVIPCLLGRDPRRIEEIWQYLYRGAYWRRGPVTMAAIAAIDHALWDIAAKALDVPVYRLLGGNVRDRVEVYCGVYTAPDVGETIDIVTRLRATAGYRAFKLSPYRRNPHAGRWGVTCASAAHWFGAIREALPEELEFAFDAHAMIFEPIRAVQLAQALAPYDPLFLEEPIRPEHIPAWTALKSKVAIPIATGECLYNRFEFLSLLAAQGADIVQPDIAVVGGLTEMRRIADLADAHYVSVMPHNPMGPLATAHNVHFAAAQTNFRLLEYRPPHHAPWAVDPYEPVDGYLGLRPDRPGWGIEIDETALETSGYLHWERRVETRADGSTTYP